MNAPNSIAEKSDGLPTDVMRPIRRTDFFRLILGTILLVLITNLIALLYLRAFPGNSGYWLIREKWRIIQELEQPVEWLILGDSGATHGVVPSVLNASLKTTSINLGTIRHTLALGDLWMLETYIRRFGPPRNVLIVRGYNSWRRNIDSQVFAQMPWEWGNKLLRDPQIDCNFHCKVQYLLSRFAPLYAENRTLTQLLMNPWRLFQAPMYLEKGGQHVVTAPDFARVEQDRQNHLRWYSGRNFRLSPMNYYALKKLQDLSDRYKFNVYLASSPIYDGLYQDKGIQAYYSQVWKSLVTVASRSPRFHCIPGPSTFPKEQMTSVDHLIKTAAEVFTRDLAATILSLQDNNYQRNSTISYPVTD